MRYGPFETASVRSLSLSSCKIISAINCGKNLYLLPIIIGDNYLV